MGLKPKHKTEVTGEIMPNEIIEELGNQTYIFYSDSDIIKARRIYAEQPNNFVNELYRLGINFETYENIYI